MPKFIANRQGQDLVSHCVLVGLLACHIIDECYGRTSLTKPGTDGATKIRQLKACARLSGFLHDIGKLDAGLQLYLRACAGLAVNTGHLGEDGVQIDDVVKGFDKFSFQDYPRHEEVSWLLVNRFFAKEKLQASFLEEVGRTATTSSSRFAMLEYAVYWHHAKPMRDAGRQEAGFGSLDRITRRIDEANSTWLDDSAHQALTDFCQQLDTKLGMVSGLLGCLRNADSQNLADANTPAFKAHYCDADALKVAGNVDRAILNEMSRTAIRSALVTADRVVSRLTAEELEWYLANQATQGSLPAYEEVVVGLDVLYYQIALMAAAFAVKYPGARTELQTSTALALASDSHRMAGAVCLQGPAGCGKSKIALQYLHQLNQLQGRNRRVFIFVPRTAIGESLFHELINEYGITANVEFLSGSKKLIHLEDGEGVQETPANLEGTGNLVITTIDQICRTMLSHQKVDLMTQLSQSHVVFDEFHELFEIPGIVLLFQELMALRQYSTAGTILVSATPNPQFLRMLGVNHVHEVKTFNQQPLNLSLHCWPAEAYATRTKTTHPFAQPGFGLSAGEFMVCNTATVAQQASIVHAIGGQEVICFHSKFTPSDKSRILGSIMQLFGPSSSDSKKVLVSGPIVQASLNLTTHSMHSEFCHAENMLQRLGRVNRFGKLATANMRLYFAPTTASIPSGTPSLANGKALAGMHQKARTLAFLYFITNKIPAAPGGQVGRTTAIVQLADVYDWYAQFHTTAQARLAYEQDYAEVVADSAKVFTNNSFDPVQIPAAFLAKAGKPGSRLSRNSLRGRSYFVLPMKAMIDASTSRAKIELLWNGESETDCLMTDELRNTQFDDKPTSDYLAWSKSANKHTTISPLVVSGADASFLSLVAKRARTTKQWTHLRQRALHRDTPIVVCKEAFDENNLYYVSIVGIKGGPINIGLSTAKSFEKINSFNFRSYF